jgi:hypothetical protein
MLTYHTRAIACRRITMVLGTGSLVLFVLAAVSPPVVAKEKYTIDPVTGTKYKPESEMRELILALRGAGRKADRDADTRGGSLAAHDGRCGRRVVEKERREFRSKQVSSGCHNGRGHDSWFGWGAVDCDAVYEECHLRGWRTGDRGSSLPLSVIGSKQSV